MNQVIEQPAHRDIMSRERYIAKEWIEEAKELTALWADSGMVPKSYLDEKNGFKPKTGAMIIAILMGRDLGLSPFASLQGIANINGMPSVWGDVMLGLCKNSGTWGTMREWEEPIDGDMTAFCEIIRKGDASVYLKRFSMIDAQRAGLMEKDTYKKYPRDMIGNRARAKALRAAYADILKGIASAEEAQDVAFEVVGTTIGEGIDLTQTAPAAKRRGRPPGIAKDAEPADVSAEDKAPAAGEKIPADPGKLPEAGQPTPTDPGQRTLGEHVEKATAAAAAASEPSKPSKPVRYGLVQTKALMKSLYDDMVMRPALVAANERMGKKLSACNEDEVDAYFRLMMQESDKLKATMSKP